MNQLKNAKTLLWLNLAFYPQLDCGIYQAKGILEMNSKQQFILSLNGKTTNPTEFILLGGGVKEKLKLRGGETTVKFYVPKPIKNSYQPLVFVQELNGLDKTLKPGAISLLKKHACRDKSLFKK